MSAAYFIAGTDTGVGKTYVSCGLLQAARAQGLSTAALKPVAAGTTREEGGWRNEDALALQAQCQPALDYAAINPVCLQAAIAPHVAAEQEGVALSVAALLPPCRALLAGAADLTLVEGAGGWLVPLNDRETLADLAMALQLPVILVVGLRLGCINHALLTAAAIRASGLPLAGWVANTIDPEMPVRSENIATLSQRLAAPLLGVLAFSEDQRLPPTDALDLSLLSTAR